MTDEEKVESQEEVQSSEGAEEVAEEGNDSAPPASDPEEKADEKSDEVENKDSADDESISDEESKQPDEENADNDKVVNEEDASEDDAEASMMAMLEDLPDEEKGAKPEDIDFKSSDVSDAKFQHLSGNTGGNKASNIDLLMDVNLPVTIELGHTKMSISDILDLGPGSVVELNKLAGEPVDVMVNYKIVAKGEVVVVDENFGVRITQLMTPEERLKQLSEEQ
ncbi:MAG: flagellar motor switch protein FliN [candidate division Zixibacteria bacterium]|nr:flagellar motor switch protein FliN [candidate division Zixibacteria bacterium]